MISGQLCQLTGRNTFKTLKNLKEKQISCCFRRGLFDFKSINHNDGKFIVLLSCNVALDMRK